MTCNHLESYLLTDRNRGTVHWCLDCGAVKINGTWKLPKEKHCKTCKHFNLPNRFFNCSMSHDPEFGCILHEGK